jgi:hypothetical protein
LVFTLRILFPVRAVAEAVGVGHPCVQGWWVGKSAVRDPCCWVAVAWVRSQLSLHSGGESARTPRADPAITHPAESEVDAQAEDQDKEDTREGESEDTEAPGLVHDLFHAGAAGLLE